MDRIIPPEVVETAQLLGARLRNDSFFTVQDVYKACDRGEMNFFKVSNEHAYDVTMRVGNKESKLRVKWLKEKMAVDKEGKVHEISR